MTTHDVIPLDPEEILTKRELAERLKVSTRTIENLHVPCLDLGYRSKRYVWSKVLKYLQNRRNGQ